MITLCYSEAGMDPFIKTYGLYKTYDEAMKHQHEAWAFFDNKDPIIYPITESNDTAGAGDDRSLLVVDITVPDAAEPIKAQKKMQETPEDTILVLVGSGRGSCVYDISELAMKNCPLTNGADVAKFIENNGTPTNRAPCDNDINLVVGPTVEWEEQKIGIEEAKGL